MNEKVWVWTFFGWMPCYVTEAEEPSGKEKVQSLCDLAVIMGLAVEDAEQMTPIELQEFLEEKMGCIE